MKTARELAEELCSVRLTMIRKRNDASDMRDYCQEHDLPEAQEDALMAIGRVLMRDVAAMMERESAILAELDALDRERGAR